MAGNYYQAGLEFLLRQPQLFNAPEIAILKWLHAAASESAAIYWDAVTAVQPGSPEHSVIENIKTKCRHYMFQHQFQQIQDYYAQAA